MEAENQQENPATDLQSSLRDHRGLNIMAGQTLEVRDLRPDLNTTGDLTPEARGRPQDPRTDLKPDLKDHLGDLKANLSLDPAMLSRCFQLPT